MMIERKGIDANMYENPSRIWAKAPNPPSCLGEGFVSISNSENITAKNVQALMKKHQPSPNSPINIPPSAGPTRRDPFMAIELSAIALLKSSIGTSRE